MHDCAWAKDKGGAGREPERWSDRGVWVFGFFINSLAMASFANIESLVRPKVGKIVGVDTNGDEYSSLKALWKKVLTPRKAGHESDWYENANSYWDNEANCPCTDGKSPFL